MPFSVASEPDPGRGESVPGPRSEVASRPDHLPLILSYAAPSLSEQCDYSQSLHTNAQKQRFCLAILWRVFAFL